MLYTMLPSAKSENAKNPEPAANNVHAPLRNPSCGACGEPASETVRHFAAEAPQRREIGWLS